LALYRGGRQAEALAAYREAHAVLVEVLGIEPGEELKALQMAILRHDEALRPPQPGARPPAADVVAELAHAGERDTPIPLHPDQEVRPRSGVERLVGRRASKVGMLAAVVLVAMVLAPVPEQSQQAIRMVAVRPDSVVRIDTGSDRIVGDSPVGAGPRALSVYQGHVWVANFDDRTVSRLGATIDSPDRIIGDVGIPADLAGGAGSVWVADPFDGSVYRVDPRKGSVSKVVRNLDGPMAVAVGFGSIWVADFLDDALLRIAPNSGHVLRAISLGDGAGPARVVVGGGAVWVIDRLAHAVSRVDPRSNRVVAPRIELCCTPDSASFGGGSLWVTSAQSRRLLRVDPTGDAVGQSVPIGCRAPLGVAWAAGSLWVTCPQDERLLRLNQRGTVLYRWPLGGPGGPVTASNGTVWVAVGTA
jgi:streptogramin lyase